MFSLEACVETLEQAIYAENNGAHRIELCSNLNLDGLSPSFELIQSVRDEISIPIHVMCRPTPSFTWNDADFELVINYIDKVKELDIQGVVLGWEKDGKLNRQILEKLAPHILPLKMIVHKVMDRSVNYFEDMNYLAGAQWCSGVLTSGTKKTAWEGRELLAEVVGSAEKNFEIVVAGKVTQANIQSLHQEIFASWYHGRKIV